MCFRETAAIRRDISNCFLLFSLMVEERGILNSCWNIFTGFDFTRSRIRTQDGKRQRHLCAKQYLQQLLKLIFELFVFELFYNLQLWKESAQLWQFLHLRPKHLELNLLLPSLPLNRATPMASAIPMPMMRPTTTMMTTTVSLAMSLLHFKVKIVDDKNDGNKRKLATRKSITAENYIVRFQTLNITI